MREARWRGDSENWSTQPVPGRMKTEKDEAGWVSWPDLEGPWTKLLT